MPYLPPQFLECSIYLYPSADDAFTGAKSGGSGFLVGIPAKQHRGLWHAYAVTARHVVHQGHSPIIRLNVRSGGIEVLDQLTEGSWTDHPDGDDVSVCPISLAQGNAYQFVTVTSFITPEAISQYKIGPGEDSFLVGRHVAFDGQVENTPSVRFGNIALMNRKIDHPGGFKQESFLVEMRSIGGFSGSPVFVYFATMGVNERLVVSADSNGWLLGVNWGHIYEPELVTDATGSPVGSGLKVRANSGVIGVAPSWKINDILQLDKFVELRARDEAQWTP